MNLCPGIRFSSSIFFFFFTLLPCYVANTANRVVVVQDPPGTVSMPDASVMPIAPILEELTRELTASGFHSEIITDAPDANLEEIAGRENASAAIRLNMRGKQVEVWVADRITGKMVARTITLNPNGEPEESLIVLAAVELLRASLMEIYSAYSKEAQLPVSKATREFAKPTVPQKPSDEIISSGYISLGGGATFLDRATGIGGHGTVALILEFRQHIQFITVGQLSFSPHTLTAAAGKTDIYPFFFSGQTAYLFRSADRRLRPTAGFGMGAAIFYSRGKQNAEYATIPGQTLNSHSQTAIVPTPFLKAGAMLRLTNQISLRIDALLGIATAITRVEIGNHTSARIGPPLFILDLALDVALW